MSHSGEKGSHNEIGLINSPNNNTDDDESLHSWLLYDSCKNDITNDSPETWGIISPESNLIMSVRSILIKV